VTNLEDFFGFQKQEISGMQNNARASGFDFLLRKSWLPY